MDQTNTRLEGRRRGIADCLDELKDLMMFVLERDGENPNKLEKADILEVTVSHLRKLKQSGTLVLTPNVTYSHKFREGFSDCAAEVSRFLSAPGSGVSRQSAKRIRSSLQKSVKRMECLPPSLLVLGDFNPGTSASSSSSSSSWEQFSSSEYSHPLH